jgi:alkanesulfonate monooxygenase SsuD/methylene tetrahydromethanopterin reductase-like flavin-dependent oxidoreductase (luciferase family)
MKIGLHLSYQNLHGMPDSEFFRQETQLAIEAEAMGFDWVGPVEHHFTDYAACPDPFGMLSWVAARTSRIELITGAVILPWNNPLRVVEQAFQLDILSGGRLTLGLGRGAARREFAPFGVELGDSREMFDEAAAIIVRGLETGVVEADGKWYRIPATEVRPRGDRALRDRMVMVTMSPSSVATAARLGIQAFRFSQEDWTHTLPHIRSYRESFRALHGREPKPLIISDFIVCADTEARVAEITDRYFARMFATVASHYEISGAHFRELPSYAGWAAMGDAANAAGGLDRVYRDYIGSNLIGTPDRMIDYHLARREMVGDYDMLANFSYGGMPYALVYDALRLFADKVMPKLKQ